MTNHANWSLQSRPKQIGRWLVWLLTVMAVVWSMRSVKIIPEFLYDAPAQSMDLFRRMWPPAWEYFPAKVLDAMIETLHIATLGTILGLMFSVPLAFVAARNFTRSPVLNWLAQLLFIASRSVNSLIWALLFVAIFGPGALAGGLAIAFRSVGFVGRLFGQALEEAHQGPIEAMTALGATRPVILAKGYWPQVEPAFWSVAVLRWDINIRESAVLGLVGAGGIGLELNASMDNLYWDQVGVILFSILVVVMITEFIAATIRRRII